LRARFDALFARAGVSPPEKAIECNSLIAARALLMESDRMMLLSAHQIHYERSAGMLAALPHPAGVVTRPIGLTMRRDWRPTRAQMRLLALVREMSHRRLGMTAGVQRKASPRRARPARRRTTSVSSSL
jgi:LysR family transcriptional regulator, regulator for genes of the gallate degradation pathway